MLQKLIALLSLIFLSIPFLSGQDDYREAFIERYASIAIEEMEKVGIPASIKLAQGIHESAFGKSTLATKAKNHFGIKCGPVWQGDTHYIVDDDRDASGKLIKSCFRAYDFAENSWRDHSKFLTDPNKKYRYGFLFDIPVTDYKAWAHGLKKSGYATDPAYASKLIATIERYDLHKYDFMESIPDESPVTTISKKIHQFNRLSFVFVQAGDAIEDIGDRYDEKTKKLLKWNELGPSDKLTEGERIYLQRKRNKYRGSKKIHHVKEGESIEYIGQFYGVKTEKLLKKNRIPKGRQPAPGAKVSIKRKLKNTPDLLPSKTIVPRHPAPKPIVVPTPTKKTRPTPPRPKSNPNDDPPKANPGYIIHVVSQGETLYALARKYQKSVDDIKAANNLIDNTLSIGQELKIPK